MAKDKDKPAKQFRCGALSAAIWKRENGEDTFYSVTPSRAYKDGEEWKYSDSLNHDDLPVMAQLLNMSFAWIAVERAKEIENSRRS